MPENPPSPPTVEAPKGAKSPARVPVKPSPPGPQAGNPIISGRRLPPGIPPGLADHIVTTGDAPAPAPVVARHPSFAPVPQDRQAFRASITRLRNQLVNAATVAEKTLAEIDAVIALAAKTPNAAAIIAAEDLDLERIQSFRTAIASALDLTK